MAEKEQEAEHQQKMAMLRNDQLYIESQTRLSNKGLNFILLLILVFFAGGVTLICYDKDISGGGLCLFGFAAMLKYLTPFRPSGK